MSDSELQYCLQDNEEDVEDLEYNIQQLQDAQSTPLQSGQEESESPFRNRYPEIPDLGALNSISKTRGRQDLCGDLQMQDIEDYPQRQNTPPQIKLRLQDKDKSREKQPRPSKQRGRPRKYPYPIYHDRTGRGKAGRPSRRIPCPQEKGNIDEQHIYSDDIDSDGQHDQVDEEFERIRNMYLKTRGQREQTHNKQAGKKGKAQSKGEVGKGEAPKEQFAGADEMGEYAVLEYNRGISSESEEDSCSSSGKKAKVKLQHMNKKIFQQDDEIQLENDKEESQVNEEQLRFEEEKIEKTAQQARKQQYITIYSNYLPEYKNRRALKYIGDKIDINVMYPHQLVYACYEEGFICEQLMHSIKEMGLYSSLQFTQKYAKQNLLDFNFQRNKFTIFDHRRLAKLLLERAVKKTYTNQRAVCLFPLELHLFLKMIYQLPQDLYEALCLQMDETYELYWWRTIGTELKGRQEINEIIAEPPEPIEEPPKKKRNPPRKPQIHEKKKQINQKDDNSEENKINSCQKSYEQSSFRPLFDSQSEFSKKSSNQMSSFGRDKPSSSKNSSSFMLSEIKSKKFSELMQKSDSNSQSEGQNESQSQSQSHIKSSNFSVSLSKSQSISTNKNKSKSKQTEKLRNRRTDKEKRSRRRSFSSSEDPNMSKNDSSSSIQNSSHVPSSRNSISQSLRHDTVSLSSGLKRQIIADDKKDRKKKADQRNKKKLFDKKYTKEENINDKVGRPSKNPATKGRKKIKSNLIVEKSSENSS